MPTVMIVDDASVTRETLERLLQREGYGTTSAANADDALDALDALAVRTPDLILLDLDAPDGDGLDLLERLSSHPRWSGLPVVVLTGVSDTHTIRQAEQLGAKDHLVKTAFSVNEMMGHVRRYTRYVPN